jgi:hypothetical protein
MYVFHRKLGANCKLQAAKGGAFNLQSHRGKLIVN